MLKTDLRAALRSLRRHPIFTVINVAGLSLGIAATLLILLYARHELTYDQHNKNAERVHLVYKERITPAGTQATYDTWVPMLGRLESDFPSIETGTREFTTDIWVQAGDKSFREDITFADSSLFDVFTLPLARGDDKNPLPDQNSVVLSQDAATRFFGDADPIGEMLTLSFERDVSVSGVLEQVPDNAVLQPDIIFPITATSWYPRNVDNWGGSFLNTYVMLREGASPAELENQMPAFIERVWDAEVAERTNIKFLPLLDQFDRQNGNRRYAYILLAIAIATILIACINFINLSTARSSESAREVGVRKMLGAFRPELVRRFLGESFLMVAVALALGIALTNLLLPWFNQLYQIDLSLNVLGNPTTVLGITILAIVVGLLSGLYPAVFMSRFAPIETLRGSFSASPAGIRLRRVLVVAQFAVSIALIVMTIVMWTQVDYMKSSDMGLDTDQIVVVPVEPSDFADRDAALVAITSFKEELGRRSDVTNVASSSHVPGDWSGWFTFAYPEGGDPEKPARMRFSFMDAAYFDTYGIDFAEGRNFRAESLADSQSVIVNRSALKAFGWESGVGKTVGRGDDRYNVVGVVEDYNFESLQEEIAPVLHFHRLRDNAVHNFVSARIKPADVSATIAGMTKLWQEVDPSRTFNYRFADEAFAELYQNQDRLVAVSSAFSILAILIACLGLFGLASLTVAQRTKEIGVRRVLGASVTNVTMVLSSEFARMVAIAFLVGSPLAWYMADSWLADFAYRTPIPWLAFPIAGLVALVISLATVGWRAVAAAMSNPVKALRYE